MEKNWGTNHIATLWSKINDIDYSILDMEILASAKQKYSDLLKNERTNPENLLIFQVISQAYSPKEEYIYTRNNGSLFDSKLSGILEYTDRIEELPYDFGPNTKVGLKCGHLHHTKDRGYWIYDSSERALGYGFFLSTWNNHQANVGKQDMETIRQLLTNLITDKYPEYFEILYEDSF